MAYTPKDGEMILSESQLATVSANERRSSYFPAGTMFDFTNSTFVGYKSSKGKQLAKAEVKKFNPGDSNGADHMLPFTMLMLAPFQQEGLLEKTEFQKRLNKCSNAGEVLALIREGGHQRIKCVEVVEASVVPYGESTARIQRFSVWDWA